jgi:hypothetical protein
VFACLLLQIPNTSRAAPITATGSVLFCFLLFIFAGKHLASALFEDVTGNYDLSPDLSTFHSSSFTLRLVTARLTPLHATIEHIRPFYGMLRCNLRPQFYDSFDEVYDLKFYSGIPQAEKRSSELAAFFSHGIMFYDSMGYGMNFITYATHVQSIDDMHLLLALDDRQPTPAWIQVLSEVCYRWLERRGITGRNRNIFS